MLSFMVPISAKTYIPVNPYIPMNPYIPVSQYIPVNPCIPMNSYVHTYQMKPCFSSDGTESNMDIKP